MSTSGRCLRSEPHFRRYACHRLPLSGSSPASLSAFRNHLSARWRVMGSVGSPGEGNKGAAPMPGRSARTLSSAALTGGEIGTVDSWPILSVSAGQRIEPYRDEEAEEELHPRTPSLLARPPPICPRPRAGSELNPAGRSVRHGLRLVVVSPPLEPAPEVELGP